MHEFYSNFAINSYRHLSVKEKAETSDFLKTQDPVKWLDT